MEVAVGVCELEAVLCCSLTPSLNSTQSKLLFHTITCEPDINVLNNNTPLKLVMKNVRILCHHLFIRASRGKVLPCSREGHTGDWTLV